MEIPILFFSVTGSVNNTESSGMSPARRTHIGVSEQTCLEGRRIDLIRFEEEP